MYWLDSRLTHWLDPQKLITGMVGFVTGLVVEPLKTLILQPRIRLVFTPDRSCVVVAAEIDAVTKEHYEASYVRVQAHNRWLFAAKNCRPYLAKIERLGHRNQVIHEDALPLSWSYQATPEPIDIPPRMYFHIDLLCASSKEAHFVPRTKTQPVFWATQLGVHGRYRLTLMLSADSMSPKLMRLILTWKGDPLALSVELDRSRSSHSQNLND